ncbi:MAG: hypothetical protein JNK05_11415 [Myxococcales bacterium]|nr:hypothetical protein [Myxococcales bacterium]
MTGFGSDNSSASMRARWLLTLSAFGVACGQPPSGADVMANDATSDQSAEDRPAMMVDAATDSGVSMDAGVAMDSGVATDSGTTADTGADRPAVPDANVGPYPAGPYGNMEGQTLEDLQLQGYVNTDGTSPSTMLPFGPTSMQDLRRTGRRYALVHTAATY